MNKSRYVRYADQSNYELTNAIQLFVNKLYADWKVTPSKAPLPTVRIVDAYMNSEKYHKQGEPQVKYAVLHIDDNNSGASIVLNVKHIMMLTYPYGVFVILHEFGHYMQMVNNVQYAPDDKISIEQDANYVGMEYLKDYKRYWLRNVQPFIMNKNDEFSVKFRIAYPDKI